MYILFDIGASQIRFARSDNLRDFGTPIIRPNSGKYMDAIVLIKEIVDKLAGKDEIKAVCGGVAGVLDEVFGKLIFSPNMTDWVGKPLVHDLQRITGVRPTIFNDAQVGGLGEAIFGGGHGHKTVAYVTASTGIGGSVTVDGKIKSHKYSFEPGHQIIDYKDGTTLSDLIAGRKLEEIHGKKPEDLSDKIWEEVSRVLAIGLHNSIVHWSPDIVVIGGGLMHRVKIGDLKSYLKKSLTMYPEIPEIVEAKLGDLNGIYGAMAYLASK